MIEVWVASSSALVEGQLARLEVALPAERRARAARFFRPVDRACCVVGHALLDYAWHCSHVGPLPSVRRTAMGKPWLPGEWWFNLSHDAGWCTLAVSAAPVGVDIQGRVGFDPDLAQRIAHPREADWIRAAQRADDLSALWTRKEAVTKRNGIGLGAHLPDIDTTAEPVATWLLVDAAVHVSVSGVRDSPVALRRLELTEAGWEDRGAVAARPVHTAPTEVAACR